MFDRFFFNDTATTEIYTLSLHDALPISKANVEERWIGGTTAPWCRSVAIPARTARGNSRSEEHTSELQSLRHLVCRLLLEKKNSILQFSISLSLGLLQAFDPLGFATAAG